MRTRTSGTGARALAIMARKARAFSGAFVVMLIPLCMAGTTAFSAAKPDDPPIYNPASESYFQLLWLTTERPNWGSAHVAASSRTFKGVRGRLAVIDRPETHQFILQNFEVNEEIWIGLRYWCRFRMLQWNDLEPYSPADPGRFHAWHPRWYRVTPSCSSWRSKELQYKPVYYQPLGGGNARWQASGPAKFFERFLIEYPTGEE